MLEAERIRGNTEKFGKSRANQKTSTKKTQTINHAGIYSRAEASLRTATKKYDHKGTFRMKEKERREGHMKDALAPGGEEGRDKLR